MSVNIFVSLIKKKFKILLNDFNPDLIISTYAFYAGVVSTLKEEGYDIPLMGVATDFYLHGYWQHPNIDSYCVPFQDSKNDFSKRGVDKKKIVVTGIPVAHKFFKRKPKSKLLKKFKLNSKDPVIMLVGGGWGGKLSKVVEMLDKSKTKIQVLVVTGTNKKLYNALKNKKLKNDFKIFGFVNNIEEIMQVSDFIVGKAGGSLLSESLASRVPTIVYGDLPAQERLNAEFFAKRKSGFFAKTDEEFEKIIKDLIKNPKKVRLYKSNMDSYSMDGANKKILKIVSNLLNGKKK